MYLTHGSGLSGYLGAAGDEVRDVDIQRLVDLIIDKIVSYEVDLKVISISIGDAIPDPIENIGSTIISGYLARELKSELDLQDKAKAKNVAKAVAGMIVDEAIGQMKQVGGLTSADINEIRGIVPFVDDNWAFFIGASPLNLPRIGVFLFENPMAKDLTGFDPRKKIAELVEDAILDLAAEVGYEPPTMDDDWFDDDVRPVDRTVMQAMGPDFSRVVTAPKVFAPAPSKLPIVPIAIAGAVALFLLK